VEIAVAIAKDLIQYCTGKSIPFGFNIESVAIRKVEVDASIDLVRTISGLLRESGLREKPALKKVDVGQVDPPLARAV
jgi:hypothetical protein